MPKGGEAIPFVSDFFNFSIYMDADAKSSRSGTSPLHAPAADGVFAIPPAYFHRYAQLSPDEARAQALEIWRTSNEK